MEADRKSADKLNFFSATNNNKTRTSTASGHFRPVILTEPAQALVFVPKYYLKMVGGAHRKKDKKQKKTKRT